MAILVVDDDPVQCRLLEGMLQKFGYEVVTRDNGDAALALLAGPDGARIGGVILDLVMPNLDGLGVLARLRQAAITVPVIVRNCLIARIGNGMRKLQKTMVQKRPANSPRWMDQKPAISEVSLPYQTVSRSAKTK